jgi:hypothetical protein
MLLGPVQIEAERQTRIDRANAETEVAIIAREVPLMRAEDHRGIAFEVKIGPQNLLATIVYFS